MLSNRSHSSVVKKGYARTSAAYTADLLQLHLGISSPFLVRFFSCCGSFSGFPVGGESFRFGGGGTASGYWHWCPPLTHVSHGLLPPSLSHLIFDLRHRRQAMLDRIGCFIRDPLLPAFSSEVAGVSLPGELSSPASGLYCSSCWAYQIDAGDVPSWAEDNSSSFLFEVIEAFGDVLDSLSPSGSVGESIDWMRSWEAILPISVLLQSCLSCAELDQRLDDLFLEVNKDGYLSKGPEKEEQYVKKASTLEISSM